MNNKKHTNMKFIKINKAKVKEGVKILFVFLAFLGVLAWIVLVAGRLVGLQQVPVYWLLLPPTACLVGMAVFVFAVGLRRIIDLLYR
ncbi:hypothetical protein HQ45_08250 [Porphyromonas crevioricanis]|nr:hypothetical protein HQ45_08250 [Porphyromonas crevioricanis]